MGIEIIRLGGERQQIAPKLKQEDFASLWFKNFHVPTPAMSIWMMAAPPGKPIMPWWKYAGDIDSDLNALNEAWNISSAQSLFDCMFLFGLSKLAGNNLYAIFPGCIKNTSWGNLRPMERETFTRGQGCIYHLHGGYDKKMTVNWVPFWEPQSLVRNPNFGSMWRLFVANTGDDVTRCLTLFSLSNPRKLPEIVNLLINKDEKRSEKLVSLVDWYGLYSSPIDPKAGTSAVIYTQSKSVMAKLTFLQTQISTAFKEAQKELLAETLPRVALRIMSRQVAL